MEGPTSTYVIRVVKNTVTGVIGTASGVKVAVAPGIGSGEDEGVDLATENVPAVLEVVLVPAATDQGHVIANGQKDRVLKTARIAEEIGIGRMRMNGVRLGLRMSLRKMMGIMTTTIMDTMLKSRLSRSLKIGNLLAPMDRAMAMTGIEFFASIFFFLLLQFDQ